MTPDFGGLLKRELFLEGAFRNAHARLRTHAESGGCEERGFCLLAGNLAMICVGRANHTRRGTSFVLYCPPLLLLLLLAVAFFGGGAREGGQIRAAFGQLTTHLRTLIGHRWAYGAGGRRVLWGGAKGLRVRPHLP